MPEVVSAPRPSRPRARGRGQGAGARRADVRDGVTVFRPRSSSSRSPLRMMPASIPSRVSPPAITSPAGSSRWRPPVADRDRAAAQRPRARVDGDLRRHARHRRRCNGRRPTHRRRPHRRGRRHRCAGGARRHGAGRARDRDRLACTRTSGLAAIARSRRRRRGGALLAVLVVLPTGIAILATHKARSPVEAVGPAPYRQVELTTSTGCGPRVVRASRSRAAIIAGQALAASAAARMLVRHGYGVLLLDRRGEGAARGLQRLRLDRQRDLRARSRSCAASRTSIRRGSAASASPSAASCYSRPPPTRRSRRRLEGRAALARQHLDNPEVGRAQRWLTGCRAGRRGRRPVEQRAARGPGGPDATDRPAAGAADRGAER